MAKIKEYDVDDIDRLSCLGKALSSPIRLEILGLLYDESLIIGEIAKKLDIPASSTAFHLKILEQAGLIRMEEQPGTRGNTKLCTRRAEKISIDLVKTNTDVDEIYSIEMPVGAYSNCEVHSPCGLCSSNEIIGEDVESAFFLPERICAGLVWMSSGYLEYKFANGVPKKRNVKRLTLTMEICSEAPGYREDWKSDITVWINGWECGTWTSPGDFGRRRGRFTPSFWPTGGTQYGLLVTWEIAKDGCYINGENVGEVTIEDLKVMDSYCIDVRIGNKEDAEYKGGLNIFGKRFGDHNQDIVLSIEYR